MSIERTIAGKARDLVSTQQAEYRSACESLPMLLRTAGLAQTAAFLKGKSAAQKTLYEHLEMQIRELGLLKGNETLIAKSTDPALAMPQYRLLVEMTMLIAFWHKRMAQALLPRGGEQ